MDMRKANIHPMGPQRLLTRLWRREEGISSLDFALVAPVLMLFMTGIIEVALAMFAQHVMEGATFSASRLGKTGGSDAGQTREQSGLTPNGDPRVVRDSARVIRPVGRAGA